MMNTSVEEGAFGAGAGSIKMMRPWLRKTDPNPLSNTVNDTIKDALATPVAKHSLPAF
jgi:hypothetical protein